MNVTTTIMTLNPCSILLLTPLEDVVIMAFNLLAGGYHYCIGIEDHLGSAEVKRRALIVRHIIRQKVYENPGGYT